MNLRNHPHLKNILIAVCGGVLGTFAFAPYNFSFSILITVFTLNYFWYQKKYQARYTFLTLVSLIYPTVFWLNTSMTEYSDVPMAVAAIAILLLSAYLSLYHTVLIYIANKMFRGQIFIKNVLLIPALWIIADYLAGNMFTGFPWVYIGYTQTDTFMNALAPIGGVYLITMVILVSVALFWYALTTKRIISYTFSVLVFVLPLFLGNLQFTESLEPISVAMVQGNISQEIKWDPSKAQDIFTTYYDESKPYFSGEKKIDLLIWPESAVPDLENFVEFLLVSLDDRALKNKFAFVTGIQTYSVNTKNYYNAVIGLGLKDPEGMQVYQPFENNRYYKRHLVPIGEKVPFEELLREYGSFFNMPMSSFTPGDTIQPNIIAAGHKIATAICYEIAYPNEMLDNIHDDTSILLTVSNDGWFGVPPKGTSSYRLSRGPLQHANIARMRALEFQKPVIRATNTGLSAVYDHGANEIMRLPFYQVSSGEVHLTPMVGSTPFGKYGLLIIFSIVSLMLSVSFLYLLMSIMTKERKLS